MARRRNEIVAVGQFRRSFGAATVDVSGFAIALANALAHGPTPLTVEGLGSWMRRAGLPVADDILRQAVKHAGRRPLSDLETGRLVGLTCEERLSCERQGRRITLPVATLVAIDETIAERRERVLGAKRLRDRERQRQKRAAAGMKQRASTIAGSLAKARPWEDEGISRATWFRRIRTMTSMAHETPVSPHIKKSQPGDTRVSTRKAPREARNSQEGPEVDTLATLAESEQSERRTARSAGHRNFAILGGKRYPSTDFALALEAGGILPSDLLLTRLAETRRMIEARRSHRPGPRLREATK
jgi:hypothetical protein